jgi:protein gp37
MTAASVGSVHLDRASGRLLVNGVPVCRGCCRKVSPGCDHCYAERIVERFKGKGAFENVTLNEERLDAPLRWRKPRRVFVNSMSDLFHDSVPDEYIAKVFAVMALSPCHTFQVLTKRHARMRSLLGAHGFWAQVGLAALDLREVWLPATGVSLDAHALPNVWLGVSIEDQKWANIRVPALLDTPAAVRFLSCEPLLGPVDLTRLRPARVGGPLYRDALCPVLDRQTAVVLEHAIDWVITGGESGPGARPMHPDWARSLRDQCTAAGVPFFFKQWGNWAPNGWRGIGRFTGRERLVGEPLDDMGHREVIERVGKHAAGRELDGRTWDEYPEAARV